MKLVERISALATSIGKDIKGLLSRVSALEALSGGGGPGGVVPGTSSRRAVSLTTPFTVIGTTLSNVPGMTTPLQANKRYSFTFVVVYQSTKAPNGINLTLGGPAGVIALAYHRYIPTNSALNNTYSMARLFSELAPASATAEANVDQLAILTGVVITGANAGNLFLQASNETTASGAQSSIRLGTYLIAEEIL